MTAAEPRAEGSRAGEPRAAGPRAAESQATVTWPVPPEGGYTVEDLDRLPDLPPHTELIDGSLVFMSPQRDFHALAVDLVLWRLRQHAPEHLRVKREMTVVLSERSAPEPDVSVIRSEAVTSRQQTRYRAADVLLTVEVVSPDSEDRDREIKPLKYAKAGIPHHWRVEASGRGDYPVVYVYERDPATGLYESTGIHREQLKVTVPFDIDIDLTEIDRM